MSAVRPVPRRRLPVATETPDTPARGRRTARARVVAASAARALFAAVEWCLDLLDRLLGPDEPVIDRAWTAFDTSMRQHTTKEPMP